MRSDRRRLMAGGLAAAGVMAVAGIGSAQTENVDELDAEERRRLRNARIAKREEIDRQVDSVIAYMLDAIPRTEDYMARAEGMLVIPVITKMGLFLGGAGGEGALRIRNETVDYYSAGQVSFGLQIGAGQYSHILFFLTPEALEGFMDSSGWSVGAQVEAAIMTEADFHGADTISKDVDVVGLVLGQQGAVIGASIKGMKYSKLGPIPE